MMLKPHRGAVGAHTPADDKRDSPELIALLERAADGDEMAFSTIVERYEKLVFNLAFQYTQNRDDAADVSQEAFLKLWRTLDTFRGESSFTTWLFRITQNCALDYLRHRAATRTVSLTVEDDDGDEGQRDIVDTTDAHNPGVAIEQGERVSAVRAAIAALRADHREILVLRELQGMSYTEIAEMLGVEIGTVKSRISRARIQVKEFLESRNIF